MNKREVKDVKKGRKKSLEFGQACQSSDEELLQAFLSGHKEAVSELFRRYRDKVYRIAYRYTGSEQDALDCTQDVFVKVLENASVFRKGARFSTWLYRIAVNQALDFLRRRRKRETAPLEMEAGSAASGSDPVLQAQRSELKERIMEALKQLSEMHRAVLTLYSEADLSYAEIAKIMGCSIGTVMSRLHHARKKLAELIGEDVLRDSKCAEKGKGKHP